VGNITSRAELTYNAIEIEFADMHTHRPVRFNDYSGFTMAAMNLDGAVFASPEVVCSSSAGHCGFAAVILLRAWCAGFGAVVLLGSVVCAVAACTRSDIASLAAMCESGIRCNADR
jgi:hypothetical protein